MRPSTLTPEALELLQSYDWPGNVRQLGHAMERAALIGERGAIDAVDMPVLGRTQPALERGGTAELPLDLRLKAELRRHERRLVAEALRRARGNRQTAAELLGIPLRTLFRKLARQCNDRARSPHALTDSSSRSPSPETWLLTDDPAPT